MYINCSTDGSSLLLYAPPIITVDQPFTVFSSEQIQSCTVRDGIGSACREVNYIDKSSLVGALTLNIPDTQATEPFDVQVVCLASNGLLQENQISTNFTVYSG